jgi:hypothetical protein
MADEVKVTATRLYPIDGGSPVYLTVTIGDDQVGTTVVTWDGAVGDPDPDITHKPFGKAGDDLRTKLLVCLTTVKDVNALTNHTSVTYLLEGGPAPISYPLQADVSENGGYASYLVTFVLS